VPESVSVRTGSGSDRIRKSHWVSKVAPDPVATAPGSDTEATLISEASLLISDVIASQILALGLTPASATQLESKLYHYPAGKKLAAV
jgi:hypothetical protein